jgi:hypothetical protein
VVCHKTQEATCRRTNPSALSVKIETVGGVGQPGLAHRCKRREQEGDADAADHTPGTDEQGRGHAQAHQLAARDTESAQGGIGATST